MTPPHPSTLSPERAANLAENPYAGQGSVLLDIGGDVGADVLHLPAAWEGAEVAYRRASEPDPHEHQPDHHHDDHHHDDHHHGTHHPRRPHVAVVGRPAGDQVAYSAVFPELVAGRYVLSLPDGSEIDVDVEGGVVTELDRVGEGPVT
jgi:hypothetical protein